MAAYLDDQQLKVEGESLGAQLESAQRQLADPKRVIVEVQLGGEPLAGPALAEAQDQPVGDRELRLYSADKRQLVTGALEQVRGRLEHARARQDDAATLLQQDDLQQGMRAVAEAVDAWQQTQQAVVQSINLLGLNLETIDVEGNTAQNLIDQLLEQLRQVRDLIVARDTVSLADALTYEWPEVTRRWDLMIGQLIDQAQ